MAARDYWVARTELRTALLGVARFRVRPEMPERARPDMFAPLTQQQTRNNQ